MTVKVSKKEKLFTSDQVAEMFDIHRRQVLYAIKQGYIKAEKLGWVWIIREGDIPDEWPNKRK